MLRGGHPANPIGKSAYHASSRWQLRLPWNHVTCLSRVSEEMSPSSDAFDRDRSGCLPRPCVVDLGGSWPRLERWRPPPLGSSSTSSSFLQRSASLQHNEFREIKLERWTATVSIDGADTSFVASWLQAGMPGEWEGPCRVVFVLPQCSWAFIVHRTRGTSTVRARSMSRARPNATIHQEQNERICPRPDCSAIPKT